LQSQTFTYGHLKFLFLIFAKSTISQGFFSANKVDGPDVTSEMTATTLVSAVRCERLHCHAEGSHIAIKFVSAPEATRGMSSRSQNEELKISVTECK